MVRSDQRIETWSKKKQEATSSHSWQLLHTWDASMSNRILGQHSLCSARASFAWGPTLQKGGSLLALGGHCVTVCTPDGTTLARIPGQKFYSAVWLSPDCKLLCAAGDARTIMVWSLPDLDLVHVLNASTHTWALWGTSNWLASAGSDGKVTVRSLETVQLLRICNIL